MIMPEDKKIAAEMVKRDLHNTLQAVANLGIEQCVLTPDLDRPAGDGDGSMMPVIIGERGQLTKKNAREAADM
jgi:hypothetical protein